MTHERATELFSDFYEGTLPSGLKQEFERLLSENPSTAHEYGVFKSMMDSFGEPQAVVPPAELGELIARRLDKAEWERKQATRPLMKWTRFGLIAATAACAVLIASLSLKNQFGGVSASLVPQNNAPEPLSVIRVGNEARIHLVPQSAETVTIYRGGSLAGFPPSDAIRIRDEALAASQALNIPLQVDGPNRQIIYVTRSSSDVRTAVIYPGTEDAPSGTLKNLAQLGTKFDLVISITGHDLPARTGTWSAVTADAAIRELLEGTSYTYVLKRGVLSISER